MVVGPLVIARAGLVVGPVVMARVTMSCNEVDV